MGKRQQEQLLKLFGKNKGQPEGMQPRRPQPAPPQHSNGNGTSVAALTALNAPARKPMAAVAGPGTSAAECNGLISDEALRHAVEVLTRLQDHPDLFRSPRFKHLRSAVYPLVQPASAVGFVARASEAIADGRWADAMIALAAMRNIGEVPKLGSVQRWVRDIDLAADADDDDGLRCLDAVLRTASPEMICPYPTEGFTSGAPVLLREPEWAGRPLMNAAAPATPPETIAAIASQFRVVLREPASVRRPPNMHDMILYLSANNAVPIRPASEVAVKRVNVPFAPESFFIDSLFSPAEAASIVAIAEHIGFTPDVPLTGKKSILAHHFVWLADEGFIENMFDRCKSILPSTLQGSKIVGINRRMRLYRYVPGAVYRAHVDGAWPPSGVDEATGEYVYDVSKGKVLSKLTFLIYLNEGFEGGWTTYFTPAYEEGHLKVTPVGPRAGCAMVFPHGDTAGCLVHEGSGVIKGTKYIIRTEVLYEQ